MTNSSSTCFCGWGIEVDLPLSNLPEKLKIQAYKFIKNKNYSNDDSFTYEYFVNTIDNYEWKIMEFLHQNNLSFESHWDCDKIYIGIKPDDMSDEKTVKEIKEETKQKLKDLGFNILSFGYIEEAWRDG